MKTEKIQKKPRTPINVGYAYGDITSLSPTMGDCVRQHFHEAVNFLILWKKLHSILNVVYSKCYLIIKSSIFKCDINIVNACLCCKI